ncbi:MAG: SDR family NAD(P)-dependent oxidoreductase, partial [Bacteroidetes bacterium]|nr:SDR family NAD(P)-dependent oxidoreductase [Bacteroidota bacterium]
MSTILVTGGTGYIGSHTTVELMESGMDVVIIDNLENSRREVIDGITEITGKAPRFEETDLRDCAATFAVFEKYPDIEAVIHFAAYKAVGESVEKPLSYYENNLLS